LDRLQRQIGRIIVGSTQDEAREVKKKINKLVQDVEEILVFEAGIPRTNAHRIIENMQEGLNYQISRNLTGSREAEYNETTANLATVEKPELQDIHEEYSRRIKQDVFHRVGELGIKITTSLEERIEQTVDEKSQEGFSDFEKALQGSVVSQGDLEKSDVKELTDNEAKFKDGETPRRTREDLEAMFK